MIFSSKKNQKESEMINQNMLFHSVMLVVGALAWIFFPILIYRSTGDLSAVLLTFLLAYTGIIISFGITSFTLDRIGYLRSYRISMILMGATCFSIMIALDNLMDYFLLLSLFRGLAEGTFWSVRNAFVLKEVHGHTRTNIINIIKGIELFIGVFIPILAGALISFTGEYVATFAIAGIMYFLGAIYPFKLNKKSQSKITSKEITRILHRKHIGKFLLLLFSNSATTAMIAITMAILPFIFLGTEFDVGILASVVGVVAAISAFIDKDFSDQKRIKLAKLSWLGYGLSNIAFALIWTTPLLIVRSLIVPFLTALGISSRDDLEANIKEKLLAEFNNESAIEMNLIVETTHFLARFFIITFMLVLLNLSGNNIDSFLKIIVFIAPITLAVLYNFFVKLSKRLKIF